MPSPTTISPDKLARLIGTPTCPALIDVRIDEDFASDPRLIPGSVRRPHDRVQEWGASIANPSVVVTCQGGKKLSEGVAAWLRHTGTPAEALEGGMTRGSRRVCQRFLPRKFRLRMQPEERSG